MEAPLQPAADIIDRVGGNKVVQSITGLSRTRIYRWTQPKEAGGTGGLIPTDQAIKILRYAKAHQLPIQAEHFLPLELHPAEAQIETVCQERVE